jgi:tRNA dimethylallyltransferase
MNTFGRKKTKILCVVGPTSSGKTALAISLAKKVGGEVVSVDSRQVYKGLNLGTGKVTKREMQGVPHHMLDVASAKKVFTVSTYVKFARKAIEDVHRRGKIPILCGGTGLYLDAVLGRITIPEVPPNMALRKVLMKKNASQLFSILKKLDARRAQAIDRHNPVRLIRAIEIAKKLGKVPLEIAVDSPYSTLVLGLLVDSKTLHKRIHKRLYARMMAGMLQEARTLHRQGLSWKRMEALGLEYRYMAKYLQGKCTKKEMLIWLEREIIKYAKRQVTWFKRDKAIVWLHQPTDALTLVNKFLYK